MAADTGLTREQWGQELAKASGRLEQTLRHAEHCKDDHSVEIAALRERVSRAEAALGSAG